jgi:hypothetical protein
VLLKTAKHLQLPQQQAVLQGVKLEQHPCLLLFEAVCISAAAPKQQQQ